MNFSGNRYTVDQLKEFLDDRKYDAMVVRARDKFGDYGIIGMAIVDIPARRTLDLMFSCRIQAKMVDHALMCYLLVPVAYFFVVKMLLFLVFFNA